MSFLTPAWLWLLAAIPLVIALHFLRNRRRHQLVSALFLWQVASDQANVRRRFALWWLLLLQILALAALAFALAQPVLLGQGVPDRVIIIDASASMAARDPEGVRLTRAVAAAAELIEPGGRLALVRAGLDATVLLPLTADTGSLSAALAGLQAADAEVDLDRALELASSLAPEGEIHLFTDKEPPARVGYTWHGVAGGGHNLGITTFDLGPHQAFVAISSTWPQPQLVSVSLERDGEPAGSSEVLVPAAGQGNVAFPIAASSGMFRVTVEPPAGDALALDDVAWAGSRPLSYFMLDDSEPLRRALLAAPGVSEAASAGAADVIVARSSRALGQLPAGNLLLFGPRVSSPEFVQIRDWSQAHRLLRFVDLLDVQVGVDPAYGSEEQPGVTVLARSADLRPLLSSYLDEGRQVVEFAFDPAQSDLIYRPAFPTLIANVMAHFRGEAAVRLGEALPPGSSRDGQEVRYALEPGLYSHPGGQLSASLLSQSQTRLPGPRASSAVEGESGQAAAAEGGDSDLTRWLLLLLPLLFVAEWLLWSRRSAPLARA